MSELTAIANRVGTDKGTLVGAAHSYSLIYEMFLAPMRMLTQLNILEIGLAIGGPELGGRVSRKVEKLPSVDMWLEYFSDAHVVGFDISDFSQMVHDRFQFVRGDAGRLQDLRKLSSTNVQFDLIIDDASHASYHQQLSLATLFDLLKPGGLYAIEDLGWQPSQIERGLPRVPPTASLLSDFVARGNMGVTAGVDMEAALTLSRSIASVAFFDESFLNALGHSYNLRFGLPPVHRPGWRSKAMHRRAFSPHFWLYTFRRFYEGLSGREFVNSKSLKLAILQKAT